MAPEHPNAVRQSGARAVPVMLVDDHAIWREGLRSALEGTEFRVVGEASTGKEALEVARQTRPQIVLMDIRMAGGDGLEALVALKQEQPRLAVLMLTTYDTAEFLARALAGGAAGYLLKGLGTDELIGSMRAVANGEMLLRARDLVEALRRVGEHAGAAQELIEPLTHREEEVLRLLTMGLSNREIAAALFIAESTVKTHVENVIGKLGVSDRVQAAVWATRHGYGPEPE
jgi:DNA-binding NarL/FixJ family response regulator